MNTLTQHIEALIYIAHPPITLEDIKLVIQEKFDHPIDDLEVKSSISSLIQKYQSNDYVNELVEISGGYTFLTKGSYHDTISIFLKQTTNKKLSKSALETLAIIAYKHPVTKTEIESIRGVNSDYTVQKLLEKELVEISGRSDGPGKPLMYSITQKFMDYFGLKNISELPKLKDLESFSNHIGEQAPIEEELSSAKLVKIEEE